MGEGGEGRVPSRFFYFSLAGARRLGGWRYICAAPLDACTDDHADDACARAPSGRAHPLRAASALRWGISPVANADPLRASPGAAAPAGRREADAPTQRIFRVAGSPSPHVLSSKLGMQLAAQTLSNANTLSHAHAHTRRRRARCLRSRCWQSPSRSGRRCASATCCGHSRRKRSRGLSPA